MDNPPQNENYVITYPYTVHFFNFFQHTNTQKYILKDVGYQFQPPLYNGSQNSLVTNILQNILYLFKQHLVRILLFI